MNMLFTLVLVLLLGWPGLTLGLVCGTGKYESLDVCRSCQSGRYSTSGGTASFACILCPSGKYSSGGAGICCLLGEWSAAGTTSCTPCVAGTSSATQGATSAALCLTCPAGTWSSTGAAACVSCDAGKYNAFTASTVSSSCFPCAPNTYSAAKAAACTPCASGRFSSGGAVVCCSLGSWSGSGALSCTQCQPGTYSVTQGATASSYCTPCEAGFYNPLAGSSSKAACLSCPAGTGGASLGLASLAACTSCPSGKFSGSSGSSSCDLCSAGSFCINGTSSLCAPGYYSGSAGASTCSACPTGTFSGSGVSTCSQCSGGSYSSAAASVCEQCSPGKFSSALASACSQCPAGTFSGPGASTCTRCSGGTWSTDGASVCEQCSAGSFSSGAGCEPCAAGSYTSSAGAAQCAQCAPGTWSSEGSTSCTQCPQGKYSSFPGLTSADFCTPCSPGTFNPNQGSSFSGACLLCAPGTFSAVSGASTCTQCAIGTASAATAATSPQSCQPCEAGSYADVPGAPACAYCRKSTFSQARGATSNATCTPCPDNGRTQGPGSDSLSLCLPFECERCTEPKSTSPPRSQADCMPILCAAPLALAPLQQCQGGCAGCPAGTVGSLAAGSSSSSSSSNGGCSPCPPNSTCPGILSLPLPSDASTLAFSRRARWQRAAPPPGPCLAASTLPRLPPPPIPGKHDAFLYTSPPPLSTLTTTAILALLLLALRTAVYHAPPRTAQRLATLLKRVDAFSLAHAVPPGQSVINSPTPLGGLCTLLSLLAFACLSTLLIVQYYYANVVVQSTLGTLLGEDPFVPGLPWGTLPAGSPLSPAFASGLQLRLLAPEGLNCSVPAELRHLPSEPWALATPSPPCGDGRTLLQLTCPACALSSASYVSFSLPYTCQAFFLELSAVDAQGVAHTVVFPPAASAATPTRLLASLAWEVEPLSTLLKDAVGGRSARGYQLFVASATSTHSADNSIAPLIKPASAAVRLHISLAPQSSYAATTLLQRQGPVELFASIVGLLGILGLFRVLFSTLESALGYRAGLLAKRRPSGAALAASPAGGAWGAAQGEAEAAAAASGAPAVQGTNPLRRAAAEAPVAPATQWRMYRDEASVWYASLDGTTSVWALPEGGEVVP